LNTNKGKYKRYNLFYLNTNKIHELLGFGGRHGKLSVSFRNENTSARRRRGGERGGRAGKLYKYS
jgi:hypothetical protein